MKDIILLLEEQQYQFMRMLEIFPQIKKLEGIEQNPAWHGEGNVLIHTRKVCEAVISSPEWEKLDREEKGTLFMAALFHDIGKLRTSRVESGVIVSPRHAVIGAHMFRQLCYLEYASDIDIPFHIREAAVSLIRMHGLPQHFMEKEPIDFYLIKARETASFQLLYLLAEADIKGRMCDDKGEVLAIVEYFKEYSEELGCFGDRISFANAFTRNRYFHAAAIWHGEELYDTTEFTVFIMAGLPLSGKDTFISSYFSDYPIISLDQIREEKRIKPNKNQAAVVAEARERAKNLLRKKQSFVFNATNIVADTRRKFCSLSEAYGARVHIVYLEVPYQTLLERNQLRERYIPLPALSRMIGKLEIPELTEACLVEYYVSDDFVSAKKK